jgi:Skp family chaperone for outer membrane proteins
MKYFTKSAITVFLFLFSPALYSQESSPDFSALDSGLDELENLISDTLSSNENLQKELESLNQILDEKENSITEQEKLLQELQTQFKKMSETYKTLSALSKRYERSSKFWKTFTIIGIPVAVVISGVTVGMVIGRR